LWRSFHPFDARCSTRTWVYRSGSPCRRFACSARAADVFKARKSGGTRSPPRQISGPIRRRPPHQSGALSMLIQQLKPLDRQVIVSYLEDMDAASIGEITGLSPANVAMRVHRVKNILARQFREGGQYASLWKRRTVWQNQSVEPSAMTLETIRRKARAACKNASRTAREHRHAAGGRRVLHPRRRNLRRPVTASRIRARPRLGPGRPILPPSGNVVRDTPWRRGFDRWS